MSKGRHRAGRRHGAATQRGAAPLVRSRLPLFAEAVSLGRARLGAPAGHGRGQRRVRRPQRRAARRPARPRRAGRRAEHGRRTRHRRRGLLRRPVREQSRPRRAGDRAADPRDRHHRYRLGVRRGGPPPRRPPDLRGGARRSRSTTPGPSPSRGSRCARRAGGRSAPTRPRRRSSGNGPANDVLGQAAELAAADADPIGDCHGSAPFRRHLARVITRRSPAVALARARQGGHRCLRRSASRSP